MVMRVVGLFIGYLIGCFQTAFILGKRKNIDIREHGSGNSGTTNAIRVMGWKIGLLTFSGDILKAVIAVILTTLIFDDKTAGLYAGIGVIAGHNWPFFLKFKGGKGIASTLGLLLAFDLRIGLVAFILSSSLVYLTKYVSLGSMLLVLCMPIGMLLLYPDNLEYLALGILVAVVAIWQHRANVGRLLRGEENKLGRKK